MSLFDLQKAWHQAVDEAQLRHPERSELAAGDLHHCTGIRTRSAIKAGPCGVSEEAACPLNASHTLGTLGTLGISLGVCVCDGSWRPNEIV